MKGIRLFLIILAIFGVGWGPAHGRSVEECPQGIVEVFEPGKLDLRTETIPLCKSSVHYKAILDGVVVGEASFPVEDLDVIIQMEGEPLAQLKGKKMPFLSAVADLERAQDRLKGEILRVENEARQAKGLAAQTLREGIKREFRYVFPGLAARVSREAIPQIESIPGVKKVWLDRKVKALLSESVPLIGANRVWDEMGAKGRGIIVAVIDTGIDYTHPDLGGCFGPGCKVVGGYDFVNHDPNPMDDNGHGTHVAGIVAANGTLQGVAPEAKLMAFKVLDQNGSGSFSAVIAAIEKAVDPDGNPNTDDGVQVINLSLGGSGDPDDPVSQAVDNAVSAGVVVVVAAGNAGPGYDTVGSPGSARLALTVGASEKIDQMASFSSRGPAPKTYQIKPEITAPGVGIRSTVPRGTCPLCGFSGYAPLNGTSMATPHVAGAVALLLEKNPDWTPPRIKEALMERSVDLVADVFTQGSGRVDAYASMTHSTVVSPANLSLGLDPTDLPVFQITQTLNITNDGISPETYALSVKGTFPSGMTASVTPASIALTPGQATSFTFTLTVNNTLVPDPTNPTHSYAGTIVALGEGEILRIPFAVLKSPALEIAFDEEPLILAVHNRSNLVKWIPDPGNPRTLLLPKGTYDVIAIFSDNVTRVIREGIPLAGKASVNISKGEAVHPFTIIPVDQNGNRLPLSPRTMMMSYFKHKTARFTDATFYWGMPPSFQFSDVNDSYSFEVSLLEQLMPVKGTTYVFNGHARDGIHGPVQFQNKPEDFRKVQFRYQVDPGVTQIFPFQMLGAVPQYMSVRWSTDLPLSSPFEQEGYYIPAPYPEFALGFVRKEIYPVGWAGGVAQDPELSYLVPFLRPQDRQILEGYFFDGFAGEAAGYRRLVLATNARELPSGIGPYNWYGRFDNRTTEIRLRPVIGSSPWFFLGQLMDLRPHDPLPYELYRSGAVIKSGSFPAVGDPSASNPDVIIPVNAGLYTLKIPFTNYWISGKQGSALLEATFDTGKSDRNPPYLLQFGITEDGRVTDTIVSGSGQVNFKVVDDGALKQASLFYDAGTGWQGFTLNKVGDREYQGYIPTFPKDTLLALRVMAEDRSGNRISYEMKPAVLVKATVQGNKPVFAVNCGGPQYVDKSGVVYQADTLYSGGGTYKTTAPIDGTEDDLLYQSERYGNFSYNIPLPSGIYSVILKLAEIYYSSAGRRIFDVKIEGKEVITNLDIAAKVGRNKAYDVTLPVTVSDGTLNIEFRTDLENAKVSAIAVMAGQAPAQFVITATASAGGTISPQGPVSVPSGGNQTFTFTPNMDYQIVDVKVDGESKGPVASYTFTNVTVHHAIEAFFAPNPSGFTLGINCGGPPYTDKTGVVYQADTFYSGGGTYKSASPIAGTEDDALYQTERYGNFIYKIPLPNGNYNVTLKLAEIYNSGAGGRVFDVKIQGKEVVSNLDIFAKAGKNKAYDLTFPVAVTDGTLNIEFKPDVGNAKVSAIFVVRQ